MKRTVRVFICFAAILACGILTSCRTVERNDEDQKAWNHPSDWEHRIPGM